MPTTTRIMTFLGFWRFFTGAPKTFVWTCGRKESNSAWYAFHTWHTRSN